MVEVFGSIIWRNFKTIFFKRKIDKKFPINKCNILSLFCGIRGYFTLLWDFEMDREPTAKVDIL
jgi:hypothetical protein